MRQADDVRRDMAAITADGGAADEVLAGRTFHAVRKLLGAGAIRAAARIQTEDGPAAWTVNAWVKRGIATGLLCGALRSTRRLEGKGLQEIVNQIPPSTLVDGGWFDNLRARRRARRAGAWISRKVHLGRRVEVGIGATIAHYATIGDGATIGTCAQIEPETWIETGAQIGARLLEPHVMPTIIESQAVIGKDTMILENVIVKRGAIIGGRSNGLRLTDNTELYDLVNKKVIAAAEGRPLVVPAGAIVIDASRALETEPGASWKLCLPTAAIVRYRRSDEYRPVRARNE